MSSKLEKKIRMRILDQLVEREFKKTIAENKAFKQFVIDPAVLKKIESYSLILKTLLGGKNNECTGYLVTERTKDEARIFDAVLSHAQEVSGGGAYQGDVKTTINEIKESNMKIIGLWHSHGGFETAPSSLDEDTEKKITTSKEIYYPLSKTETIDHFFEENEDSFNLSMISASPAGYSLKEEMTVHFSEDGQVTTKKGLINTIKLWYILIINNSKQKTAHANYKVWLPKNKKFGQPITKEIPLEVVSFSPYVNVSMLDLAKEVMERVKVNGEYVGDVQLAKQNFDRFKDEWEKEIIRSKGEPTKSPRRYLGEKQEDSSEKIKILEKQVTELTEEKQTAEDKAALAIDQQEQYDKKTKKLTSELDTTKQELAKAKQKATEFEQQLENLTKQFTHEVNKYKQESDAERKKAVEEIEERFEKHKKQIDKKLEGYDSKKEEVAGIKQELTRKEEEVAGLKQEITDRDQAITNYLSARQDLEELVKKTGKAEQKKGALKTAEPAQKLSPAPKAKIPKPATPTQESPKEDFYTQGVRVYQKKDYQGALDKFKKSVEVKERKSTESLRYVGNCYKHMERKQEALEIYKQCIAKDKNNSNVLYSLGKMYFELSNVLEALRVWEQAARLGDPDTIKVVNKFETHLGYHYDRNLTKEEEEQLNTLKRIIVQNATK